MGGNRTWYLPNISRYEIILRTLRRTPKLMQFNHMLGNINKGKSCFQERVRFSLELNSHKKYRCIFFTLFN